MSAGCITNLLRARAEIDRALHILDHDPLEFSGSALGPLIENRRRTLKLSLQEVGDAVGVSKTHVWELEQGRAKNPTVRMMTLLARALNLPRVVLLDACVNDPSA